MRKRGVQPMHDDHINVTPLIDVVMCLIIFFLLCGQLAKAESLKGIKVPTARNGMDLANKKHQMIVNVQLSDSHNVNARPKIVVWGETMTMTGLSQAMRKEKAMDPRVKLVVRADKRMPYRYIAPVLAAAGQMGIVSVNFMTRPGS